MTLEEGISAYVQRKQSVGMSYAKALRTYRAFLTAVGNLDIRQITIHHISEFLDRAQTSVAAFRRKHSLLRRFFEYWAAHGAIAPLPMPLNRPAQRSNFLPYIYTSEELRKLLRLSLVVGTANDKIQLKTIRAALLTLYATGATVGEVTRLGREDIDLPNGLIKFAGSQFKASRCIPIGRDIVRVAHQYIAWQKRTGAHGEFLFSRIDGTRITPPRTSRLFRATSQNSRNRRLPPQQPSSVPPRFESDVCRPSDRLVDKKKRRFEPDAACISRIHG